MPASAYTPPIKTKITIPPLRRHVVVRQRLIELLDEATIRPLTLISAPAGFGKTTLVTTWLKQRTLSSRVAWLSLDSADSDPVHFLYYMISALQGIEPRVGRAPISLVGSLRMPGPRDLMALVVNELLEIKEPILLVLDDYHAVDNDDIDASLEFLVERMPEKLRLAILTREAPPLPLARWRTLEQVSEIGADELRFSYEEAVLFLRQTMGLDVDPKSARALESRTEGWIAGLQLAALSLRLRGRGESMLETAESVAAFSGRNRYIVDYLAAEVLRRQPDDIRTFLTQTAILDRLCAPLCDAVTGRDDSNEILSRLENGNMFLVRLDEEREWYRYHQLFADFLRASLSASDECELHRKASAWYESAGFGAEAIKHALAASDVPASVRLIRAQVEDALSHGENPTLLGWLSALPESALREHGDLAGYKALLLYLRGESAEAQVYSDLAHAVEHTDAPPAQLGTLYAFRAYLALNWADPKDAIPLARRALEQLGDSASFFRPYALCMLGQAQGLTSDRRSASDTLRETVEVSRRLGNHLMTVDALGHLATVMNAQGQLREAIVLCRNAVDLYVDGNEKALPITGLVQVPLGILYYEHGDLVSARRYLTSGINLCEQVGMIYFRLLGKCALARLQHIGGEPEAAWMTLAAAREVSDRPQSPRRQRLVAVATAELQLREGNVSAAARSLAAAKQLLGQPPDQEVMMQARLLLAEHNPSAAWKLLSVLEESAKTDGCDGSLIAISVLQAMCKRALGQHTGAQERLENAVSLASSPGYRRVFLDEGTNLSAMLEHVRHVAPAFVASLLEPPAPAERDVPPPGALLEPLSRTELDILVLLNRGLTNQEIADKLAMTVGTTKWRMNQIFGKLQVRNRIEALARARQLKLL